MRKLIVMSTAKGDWFGQIEEIGGSALIGNEWFMKISGESM